MAPEGHASCDPLGCTLNSFMCPYPKHAPTSAAQLARLSHVPATIRFEFRPPPIAIPFRPTRVPRARVPEAAVNKDCYLGIGDNQVDSYSGPLDRDPLGATEGDAGVRERERQPLFWRSVCRAVCPH
jgi:hypothetical protein